MTRLSGCTAILIALAIAAAGSAAESPYAGLESRPIKALSQEQVDAYEAGDGMGFALAAELNRYPGPKHVLELQDELELTAGQAASTRTVFNRMKAEAVGLGRRIVEAERGLDQLFATGAITSAGLADAVSTIGALTGQLRAAHLEAHLDMVEILTEEQVTRYEALRGYSGEAPGHDRHHGHQGHHDGAKQDRP